MLTSSERIQVLFEISSSIGVSLDLKPMLKRSLSKMVISLNCSAGGVYQYKKEVFDLGALQKAYSIPQSMKDVSLVQEALNYYSRVLSRKNNSYLEENLPFAGQSKSGGYYYIFNLLGFGILILARGSTGLDTVTVNSLAPITDQLSNACIACIQSENLENARLELLKLNQELIEKTSKLKEHENDLENIVTNRTQELEDRLVELRKARDEAKISDQLKNLFIGTMSHEMRNPLNVIKGYANILDENSDKFIDEEKEYLTNIVSSGIRLEKLVNDVLDISQIEAGRDIMDFKEYKGDELVKRAISENLLSARNKSLRLVNRLQGKNSFIRVDKMRFLQSLGNIIQNAIKFTYEGQVTISTSQKNGFFTVSVKDTGVGIKKIFRPYIFSLFRQQEEGYTRRFEGAGLGLAICKRLVTAMDGNIDVMSEKGNGSRFTLSFPLVETTAHDEIAIQDQPAVKERKPKRGLNNILILEDNEANLRYAEFLLKKLNINVITAESGERALKLLEETAVDCVLVDISLGTGMDGIEFLKQFRKAKTNKTVLAIAVTAHALVGDKERLIKEGFDGYLPKPYLLKDLSKVLDEI